MLTQIGFGSLLKLVPQMWLMNGFKIRHQRNVSITSLNLNKQTIQKNMIRRTERYLKKTVDLLQGTRTSKKKKWNFMPDKSFSSINSYSISNGGHHRRARQLSVVFNEYITAMISSGEICPELLDLDFELVKVQMLPDLSAINVQWLAHDNEKDDEIISLLPKCSSLLRSTLTGLRIMGHIPPIQFSKDLRFSRLQKVEELLKIADMGSDFEPTDDDDLEKVVSVRASKELLNKELQIITKRFGFFLVDQKVEGSSVEKEVQKAASDNYNGVIVLDIGNQEEYLQSKHVTDNQNSTATKLLNKLQSTPQTELRSDLYGINHHQLKQKVLQAKRKLQDRSHNLDYQKKIDETEEPKEELHVKLNKMSQNRENMTIKRINHLISGKKTKDRPFRNADSVLSSFHHVPNDDGDDNQNDYDGFNDNDNH